MFFFDITNIIYSYVQWGERHCQTFVLVNTINTTFSLALSIQETKITSFP